jgi:hypothetical protein
MSDTARETAREIAKTTPLQNAQTLRGIYDDYKNKDKIDNYRFPAWVLDDDRWDENSGEKSHKFDDTIVVYDNEAELNQVKELVEQREPVNIGMDRNYNKNNLETNFGWKHGAYEKSTNSKLYPNIGIYCNARVTNKTKTDEKNVHVMNLIGYAFDSTDQPDYQYFLETYGDGGSDLNTLSDETNKKNFKEDLIQRYRKIWLKACYICKLKVLENLWYYGVGSGWFSNLLPKEYNKASGNFYKEIFAPAFGIDPTDSIKLHSTNIDESDLTIPINFCKKYKINVQNLGPSSDKWIPDVLFTIDTTPANTLYINAWDPWSIIGNGNAGDDSLDGYWGGNSNMSVLGWSMTNSKLLPDITGTRPDTEKSKILSMREILADIQAAGGSGASQPPPTPSCTIENPGTTNPSIKNITPECQQDIFGSVTAPVIGQPTGADEPTEMSNLVSAIGTDYSINYAGENIMPAGSATLLYIGDNDLYSIKQVIITDASGNKTTTWEPEKKTNTKIKYMIHASPAKSDNVERDISKDTISNSVMNSLILAAKNGVKKIIFPFIGGVIFYDALKKNVDALLKDSDKKYDKEQHAKVLVKGVTNFYTNFSSYVNASTPIEKIYFLTYGTNSDEETGMQKAITQAIASNDELKDVLEQLTQGTLISNVTQPHGKENIDAIVNAGNTNHGFANGSGIADMCFAALNDNQSYQTKLNTIKTKFIEAFNAYIKNHSASSTSSPSKSATSKPVDEVIKDLITGIKADEDNEATLLALSIKQPSDLVYKYAPPGGVSSQEDKNLNCATPLIKDMIEAFETAGGGETNFYLGACRSIQAAYELEISGIPADASANEAKMRAKLLLNLRKNSLLLKVPTRWDYATMQPGKVEEPPTDLTGLMTYSLQKTIEYYSQEGGANPDEKARFAELKIDEEPVMIWEFILNLTNHAIDGVDRRFVKGINADMAQACFFVSTLQLLFCDEDFLQLIIFLSCKSDDYISSIQGISGNECVKKSISDLETRQNESYDESQPTPIQASNVERGKNFLNDLVKLFKAYTNGKKINSEIMKSLYDTLALRYGKQQDSGEVITRIIAYLECLDNPYVKKYLSNNFLELTETITYPKHADFINKADKIIPTRLRDKLIVTKIPAPVSFSSLSVQTLVDSYLDEEQDFQFESGDIINNNIREKIIDQYLTSTPPFITKTFCEMCQEFLTFSNNTSNKANLASIFEGYDTKSAEYTTENSEQAPRAREQSELKITLDNIQKAIYASTTDEEICHMIVEDIKYVILNPMVNESSSSTYTNLKKTSKKSVSKYSEYIFININRTLTRGKKNTIDINISKTLDISNSTYTLVGYVFHSGPTSTGGHFVCVKCDSNGEPKVQISDSNVTKWTDKYENMTQWGTGVFLLIYKQKKVIQGGGGFKPRHNPITNHAKSKHNSSFKSSSSSKSKGKSHSRSHTQRVK